MTGHFLDRPHRNAPIPTIRSKPPKTNQRRSLAALESGNTMLTAGVPAGAAAGAGALPGAAAGASGSAGSIDVGEPAGGPPCTAWRLSRRGVGRRGAAGAGVDGVGAAAGAGATAGA